MSTKTRKRDAQADEEVISSDIDAIFRARYHGAANIRGIKYQILYSVLRAFDLYADDNAYGSIRLEGIEDLDLLGLRLEDEYIQVKTSQEPWKWSQLKSYKNSKGPIENFLEIYRLNPNCHFVLVVNFQLKGDLEKLAQIESLPPRDKKIIEEMFRKLCHQIGASTTEADALASRLCIVSMSEDQIWRKLRPAVADSFNIGSEAVETYISALVAKFLDWAKDRKTINRTDLEGVRANVGEPLSREVEWQGYGRGLIDRISWDSDANIEDFFEGKRTRQGHIASNVDVRRPIWLERIDKAINSSKICILRSSSGQGKSSLLYRYAYEKWPAENTFILRVAESQEHVELIRDHLRFRANLGVPIFLLIDNAGWSTRFWPFVAQECAALGVQVLISVRNEDWHRFARECLTNYEIIEPILILDEAQQIFEAFRSKGRLHESISSPEWAYEKIGEPHLLMEYVYLLTHGHMLEERLRDQLKQFSEQGEDPAKVEILRRISLADSLGAPVAVDKLLVDIQLTDDPQQVLMSLSGEYIDLVDGILTGLHWVRSDHLTHILHEGYPNPCKTALAVFGAIPLERIPVFVSNALSKDDLDKELFMNGLIEKAKENDLNIILAIVDGIFEAGERKFFQVNQSLFDEAYELFGPSGILPLILKFAPVIKVDILTKMIGILGENKENFKKLTEIASQIVESDRGLDLVRDFLNYIILDIPSKKLQETPDDMGRLFDWCSLCNIHVSTWTNIFDNYISDMKIFNYSLDAFSIFAQGFYRYDGPAYMKWFSQNKENILGYLKLHVNCIELNVSDDTLYIEFFTDSDESQSINEQAVQRFNKLRSSIPFCESYQSQGIWFLPSGLTPSIDDSRKNIPKGNLPFKSDIEKNLIWKHIVDNYYLSDSYYIYEKSWYNLRNDGLCFVKAFSKGLQNILVGKKFDFQKAFDGGKLPDRLMDLLRYLPDPPSQAPVHLSKALKGTTNKWSTSLQNFLLQIFEYFQDVRKQRIGRLAVHNFLCAVKYLPEMHSIFNQLFENVPDYFDVSELDISEVKNYEILADLLDVWIIEPPKTPQRNIMQYIRKRRQQKRQEMLNRIQDVNAHLKEYGMIIIPPIDAYIKHPLCYMPLAFSVKDPIYPEASLDIVIEAISDVKDIADIFYLVPIHEGVRFLEGGYQISSNQITKFNEGQLTNWEAFALQELSEDILRCLPALPFCPSVRLQIRASITSLLIGMIVFIEQKDKIETLRTSENQFEVKLYDRHKSRLIEIQADFGIAACKIMDYLKAEYSSLQEDIDFKTLIGFLKITEEASQKDSIDTLFVSGDFNAGNILNATEQLLQK
ncbi:dsDNA nuclease domain-containing protein [Methanothrix soehngenii]|uniref:Uncharacterized protein n=2 Tax=Methanothrix TaxID=2222 RepID=F4BT66_METSG|nr:dsDNA nuclease domain-containing protein [Methanothrix soehngenii]AEB69355.1 conserved hypothetical protein [Methanothrix soehngenii GP6]